MELGSRILPGSCPVVGIESQGWADVSQGLAWGVEGNAVDLSGVAQANVHHRPIFFLPGNPIRGAVLASSSG